MTDQDFRKITERQKNIKNYKGKEVVERHDRLQPEGTRHIKKIKSFVFLFFPILLVLLLSP